MDEQHELSKWLQSDERNAETLKQIHTYWHYHKDNLEEEEQEVRSRLHDMMQAEMSSQTQAGKETTWQMVYRIAASIVIVCSLAFMLYQYKTGSAVDSNQIATRLIEKVSLPGQKVTTLLPDGTKVKLNADSKLIVPAQFEGQTREVTLIGEAFFDVKRDEHRPFIIKTDKIDIKVLGTSFNVQAYSDDVPKVAVKSGKVAVKHRDNEGVDLMPDQMVLLKGSDLIKTSISSLANPFAWTDQRLVFHDESLSQVLKKVSRWYGVQINLKREITLNKKYTANYHNPTLVEMMDVLAFVYDFEYEFSENEQEITIR